MTIWTIIGLVATCVILLAALFIWSLCRAAAGIESVHPDCGEYESGGRDE